MVGLYSRATIPASGPSWNHRSPGFDSLQGLSLSLPCGGLDCMNRSIELKTLRTTHVDRNIAFWSTPFSVLRAGIIVGWTPTINDRPSYVRSPCSARRSACLTVTVSVALRSRRCTSPVDLCSIARKLAAQRLSEANELNRAKSDRSCVRVLLGIGEAIYP